MYRFHPDSKTAALALALSSLVAVGMTVSAVVATGGMPATAPAKTMAAPAASDDAMAHLPATAAIHSLACRGCGDLYNFHRMGRMYAATDQPQGGARHQTDRQPGQERG